jgi:hypothetical protein
MSTIMEEEAMEQKLVCTVCVCVKYNLYRLFSIALLNAVLTMPMLAVGRDIFAIMI